MGKIIHDIEVNVWERKLMPETYLVKEQVNTIISNSIGNTEIIEKSVKYFNALYNTKVLPLKAVKILPKEPIIPMCSLICAKIIQICYN
jgi:hypothetical protein